MKNTIRLAGIALAMLAGSVSAQANEIKPYLGVGVGLFTTDYGTVAGTTIDSPNKMGYFIRAGADFHEYLGAELRFGGVSSAEAEANGVAVAGSSSKVDYFISYLLKPKAELGNNLNIYGLIGATTAKATLTAGAITGSATKTKVTFGGGLEYGFNDQLSLGVEYAQYSNKADATNDNVKISGFAATINTSF